MKSFLNFVAWAIGAALIILGLTYILPLAAPFLIAFIAAAAMEPVVAKLNSKGVSRNCAAGILTVIVMIVLGILVTLLFSKGFSALSSFAQQTPALLEDISHSLGALKERLVSFIQSASPDMAGELTAALGTVTEEIYAIPVWLSEKLLSMVTQMARRSPDMLLSTATTAVGVYFFSSSYREITAFIKRQLPQKVTGKFQHAWSGIKSASMGYLRVQLILMAVTFVELSIAFFLLGVSRPIFIAALTAVIDALPVLGAGIVLLPWMVYSFIVGNMTRAIGLLATYLVITGVRNTIQAKLLGDQLGLHPVVSLITIYIGWKLCGITGMILFPIAAVVIQQLNEMGTIHLYKNEDEH